MSAPAAKFAADPRRRAMIGKVKIAQKELGLDEATYRATLQRLTGVSSAASCSTAQLGQVLDYFKAQGWTSASPAAHRTDNSPGRKAARVMAANPPRRRAADHPSAKKARALWISLHQLGEVRNPSEAALEAFARRQLGCERLQWADQGLTFRLIEALKAMAERAGWSQDLAGFQGRFHVQVLKHRLLDVLAERAGDPELGSRYLGDGQDLDLAIEYAARRLREAAMMEAGGDLPLP